MEPLQRIAANWQKALPYLSVLGAIIWIGLFRGIPFSERALFMGLLVLYMVHQIEEHLWPGGFRQFANMHVFKSGKDNWPVDIGGVALVNIGFVWLPVVLAVLFPATFRWVGLLWVGLTLINAVTHIASTIRLKIYNPGLVTSIILFLPFTIFVLARELQTGSLSPAEVAIVLVGGVVLHIPVAAIFALPFIHQRRAAP